MKTFALLALLALLVGAPAIALALVWQLPDTLATAPSFLGMTLEPIRADALSRLFGTVFALMGIAGAPMRFVNLTLRNSFQPASIADSVRRVHDALFMSSF